MIKTRIVTVKDLTRKTLRHLHELGTLHVEEAKELEPADRAAIARERNQIRKSLTFIEDLLSYLTLPKTVLLAEDMEPPSLEEMTAQINKLQDRFVRLCEEIDRQEAHVVDLQELGKYLAILAREINIPLKDLRYSGNYLFSKVVICSEDAYKSFKEKASQHLLSDISISVQGDVVTYLFAKAANRKAMETLMANLDIAPLKIPDEELTMTEFLAENDKMIRIAKQTIQECQEEIQQMIEGNLEQIIVYREVLTATNERLSVLEQSGETRYVTLIEGWIPQSKVDHVTSSLQDTGEYILVDTRKPDVMDEPPTKLQNHRFSRPFQIIVSLFSLPKYGDWDPTPIVAYFFAFFFGIMLNDVVYALGLILVARFLLKKLVDDPSSEGVHLFRNVLYISGAVGLIVGMASGTYLGDFLKMYLGINLSTVALAKKVQQHLSNSISFIVLSLIIGLVHVNAAHILALIRGIREGNRGVILGKSGLFLAEIFGIPYLLKTVLHLEVFPLGTEVYSLFFYPLLVGLILIAAGSCWHMGALGAFVWIFDITGFLGDIMSYSRLAGVGLATFYLASSFNLLAEWLSAASASLIPGVVGYILAFFVGVLLLTALHMFNMLLSSLAAFIHSLRLCFVEFLMKFFEGGGRKYRPFELAPHRRIVVGAKS